MAQRIPLRSRVRLRGIKDEDVNLNGRVGILTQKFQFRNYNPDVTFGEIGVLLDRPGKTGQPVNVLWSEIEEAE